MARDRRCTAERIPAAPAMRSPRLVERPRMRTLTFYHNPNCSKSRTALAMLEERGLKDVTKLL